MVSDKKNAYRLHMETKKIMLSQIWEAVYSPNKVHSFVLINSVLIYHESLSYIEKKLQIILQYSTKPLLKKYEF